MKKLSGIILIASCISNFANADMNCTNKVFASIQAARQGLGINSNNQIAIGAPSKELTMNIDVKSVRVGAGETADVLGFMIGSEDVAVLSAGGQIEENPGATAIGTVVVIKDSKTFGANVCDIVKIDIRKNR